MVAKRRDGDHVDVFSPKNIANFKDGVLGVETAHQFTRFRGSKGARLVPPDHRRGVNDDNEGSRSSTYQSFVCALTISEVEALPAKRNTATKDRPITRRRSFSGAAQTTEQRIGRTGRPASQDDAARCRSTRSPALVTLTGKSVSCSIVVCLKMETSGRKG